MVKFVALMVTDKETYVPLEMEAPYYPENTVESIKTVVDSANRSEPKDYVDCFGYVTEATEEIWEVLE